MTENNAQNGVGSVFNNLSPVQTFVLGIVGGFLVLCTIGFFVLLSMFLDGDSFAKGDNQKQGIAINDNTNPQPSQPTQVSLAPVGEDEHIRGDEDAEITIVEYSDFECPFCQRFHETMLQVMEQYDGEVRWVYRHLPLESIHPNARGAAIASECAADQGKFWEYADVLFQNQSSLSVSGLKSLAGQVGLNQSAFDSCLDSKEFDGEVNEDIQTATAAGARGTPHSIIVDKDGNTQAISGAQPFNVVDTQLKQLLQ